MPDSDSDEGRKADRGGNADGQNLHGKHEETHSEPGNRQNDLIRMHDRNRDARVGPRRGTELRLGLEIGTENRLWGAEGGGMDEMN